MFSKLDFCTGISCILGCLEVPTQLRLILSFSLSASICQVLELQAGTTMPSRALNPQAADQAHCLLGYSHGAHVETTCVC